MTTRANFNVVVDGKVVKSDLSDRKAREAAWSLRQQGKKASKVKAGRVPTSK